jgi:hypothetical protein
MCFIRSLTLSHSHTPTLSLSHTYTHTHTHTHTHTLSHTHTHTLTHTHIQTHKPTNPLVNHMSTSIHQYINTPSLVLYSQDQDQDPGFIQHRNKIRNKTKNTFNIQHHQAQNSQVPSPKSQVPSPKSQVPSPKSQVTSHKSQPNTTDIYCNENIL